MYKYVPWKRKRKKCLFEAKREMGHDLTVRLSSAETKGSLRRVQCCVCNRDWIHVVYV